MKFMGSKNRVSRFILPIMLKEAQAKGITTWIEPFVGGANLIDKVPNSFKRIGLDISPHTINALIGIRDFLDQLPNNVTKEEYNKIKNTEPNPITSWLRFVCSFGANFSSSFATSYKTNRNFAQEGVNNAKKQSPKIQNIEFIISNYADFEFEYEENCLIYCDPPYNYTSNYKNTPAFESDKFWGWCREMGKKHLVFVSELTAPDDFECIWEKGIIHGIDFKRGQSKKATEKLFRYRGSK